MSRQLLQQSKKPFEEFEKKRLLRMNFYEQEARSQGFKFIAGIDEAGRGPLAGPVVAAACIISEGIYFPHINDSKQVSPSMRELLFDQITKHPGVFFFYSFYFSRRNR